MKFFTVLATCFMLSANTAAEPLRIGVDSFSPPFVIRGANNQLFGFDIAMMSNLCTIMNRACEFVPMNFSKLLPSVQAKKIDLAVGAITITSERALLVNFSTPYLISNSLVLALNKNQQGAYTPQLLDNKKIGIQEGSIYGQVINAMGIIKPVIIQYEQAAQIIQSLQSGTVDYAVMDAPDALYWQSQSSNLLTVLGKPFTFGFGLGIAVNVGDTQLLSSINYALSLYLTSPQFKKDYVPYLGYF